MLVENNLNGMIFNVSCTAAMGINSCDCLPHRYSTLLLDLTVVSGNMKGNRRVDTDPTRDPTRVEFHFFSDSQQHKPPMICYTFLQEILDPLTSLFGGWSLIALHIGSLQQGFSPTNNQPVS